MSSALFFTLLRFALLGLLRFLLAGLAWVTLDSQAVCASDFSKGINVRRLKLLEFLGGIVPEVSFLVLVRRFDTLLEGFTLLPRFEKLGMTRRRVGEHTSAT